MKMNRFCSRSMVWLIAPFMLAAAHAQTATGVNQLQPVSVSVNFKALVRQVSPLAYGVNCPACFDPSWSQSAKLLDPLAAITSGAKPLIRLHGWGMVTQGSNECWLNADGTWNAPKIESALAPLVKAGYNVMIDIPAGPGGEKDPLDADAMASLAAALVKIVNVDNEFHIRYWEIPNEREHILSAPQMATLLSRASYAMKKVDPSILVGGPATEGVNVEYISQVAKLSLSDLDFVTAHTYGGDGKQTASESFNSAIKAVADVRKLRERLDAENKGKHLPIFLDEYNIGWDANPGIYNNEGAVYFSIIQSGVVDAGADASTVWDFSPPHDMSIVRSDGTLTLSANLFSLMNQFFGGREAQSESSDQARVRVFATESASSRSILLTNPSESVGEVHIRLRGAISHRVNVYRIASTGFKVEKRRPWKNCHGTVSTPAHSVTVLVFLAAH